MRTIKFRAFNIKENKMIDWEALIGYCDIDYLFGGGYLRVNKRHSNFIYPIAMQFTGLHDKNGVEIFEGDVIHSDTHNENFVIKIKLSKLTNPLLAMPTTFAFSGFFILELENV